MQRQDSGALTLVPPHLGFQIPPPKERRLSLAQFTPSEPTVAPSFKLREDLRKVRLEKTNPSKSTNIRRSLNLA